MADIPPPIGFTGALNNPDEDPKREEQRKKGLIADCIEYHHKVATHMINWAFKDKADQIRAEISSGDLAFHAVKELVESDRQWKHGEFAKTVKAVIRNDIRDTLRKNSSRQAAQERKAEATPEAVDDFPEMIALYDMFAAMKEWDSVKAAVFDLRFFGGLTFEEIGKELGISRDTASTYWKMALGFMGRNGYGE